MAAIMLDDLRLLQDFARLRDAEAFATLVQRHAAMVYGTCRRITRHEQDAEDACQDTFLELARQAGRVNGCVGGWLHAVASRIALRVRAAHRRVEALDEETLVAQDGEPDRQALLRAVDAALGSIDDGLRAVLVLRFLEGQTQEEIAQETGMSQPTVHRRIAQALEGLHQELRRRGVEAPALLLPAALEQAASMRPPEALLQGLGKLALGTVAAASAKGAGLSALIIAGLTGVAVIAGGVCWLRSGDEQGAASAPLPHSHDGNGRQTMENTESGKDEDLRSIRVDLSLRRQAPWRTRNAVEFALRRQGRKVMIELCEAIKEEQPLVTLTLHGRPLGEVLDAICDQWSARWEMSPQGISVYRSIPEPELRTLLATLDDTKATVPARRCAASAVARSHDPEAIGRMLAGFGKDAERDQLAATALRGATCGPDDRPESTLVAPSLSADHRAILERYWLDLAPERFGCSQIQAAGDFQCRALIPRLRGILEEPDRHLAWTATPLQRRVFQTMAAYALGRLGSVEAVPAIRRLLGDPAFAPVRARLVVALGRLGVVEDLKALIPAADRRLRGGIYDGLWIADPGAPAACVEGLEPTVRDQLLNVWATRQWEYPSAALFPDFARLALAETDWKKAGDWIECLRESGAALTPAELGRTLSWRNRPTAVGFLVAYVVRADRGADGSWEAVWGALPTAEVRASGACFKIGSLLGSMSGVGLVPRWHSGADASAEPFASLYRRLGRDPGPVLVELAAWGDLEEGNRILRESFDAWDADRRAAVLNGWERSRDPAVIAFLGQRLRTQDPAALRPFLRGYAHPELTAIVRDLIVSHPSQDIVRACIEAQMGWAAFADYRRFLALLRQEQRPWVVAAVGGVGPWHHPDGPCDLAQEELDLGLSWTRHPDASVRAAACAGLARWRHLQDESLVQILERLREMLAQETDAAVLTAIGGTVDALNAASDGERWTEHPDLLWLHALRGSFDDADAIRRIQALLAECRKTVAEKRARQADGF